MSSPTDKFKSPRVGSGSDEESDQPRRMSSEDNDFQIPDAEEQTAVENRAVQESSDDDANSYGSRETREELDNDDPETEPEDEDDNRVWKGCPKEDLPQAPECFKNESPLPPLRNDPPKHNVFFVTNGRLQEARDLPGLLQGEFKDNWEDDQMVKMPCSKGNWIPHPDKRNDRLSRWELIEKTLKNDIQDSYALENRTDEERKHFFSKTLRDMIKLALALPNYFTEAIPFLKQRSNKNLTFSQQQVACLLANAFFCTFPRRNLRTKGEACPDINFSSMFCRPGNLQRMSKIKCILHYFERVTTNMPKGVITYSRRVLRKEVHWENDKTKLTKLHMTPLGTIEDYGKDMLQADFANKYVGGGVLGHGCVQEEIRFLICPEMILSRLFTEYLLDNEVLVMTGCERYSKYTGYSTSFRWDDNFNDDVGRDEWGRRYTEVVAMDALAIKRSMDQFQKKLIIRELNKAFCAFKEEDRKTPAAVCTGNWGCGAFGGNAELKGLIQIMAASKAKRDVCFLSVGDKKLCRELSNIHKSCLDSNLTVGDLFQVIMEFSRTSHKNLLDYIARNYNMR